MSEEFRRVLTLRSAVLLVVGNVIGVGIFTTTGIVAEYVKSGLGIVALWALGGIITIFGALVYGELASLFPLSGGDYVYIREIYGKLPAFLLGWAGLLVINTGSVAALSVGLMEYAGPLPDTLKKLCACGVVVFLSAVNMLGIDKGSRLQDVFTLPIILFLCAFTVAGVFAGRGNWGNLAGPLFVEKSVIGPSMFPIIFSYSGWFASAYVAQEVRDPEKNLPLSLILGVLIVTFIYVGVNIVYVYGVPVKDMAGAVNVAHLASANLFGTALSPLISVFVMVSILSSLNSVIITSPRVYYAMSKDGLFFKWAGKVHGRWKTPHASIIVQAVLAGVLAVLGKFKELLMFVTIIMVLSSIFSCFGLFVARMKLKLTERPYRTPGYPLVPLIFLAFHVFVAVEVFKTEPVEAAAGFLILLAGIPVYYVWRRLA